MHEVTHALILFLSNHYSCNFNPGIIQTDFSDHDFTFIMKGTKHPANVEQQGAKVYYDFKHFYQEDFCNQLKNDNIDNILNINDPNAACDILISKINRPLKNNCYLLKLVKT